MFKNTFLRCTHTHPHTHTQTHTHTPHARTHWYMCMFLVVRVRFWLCVSVCLCVCVIVCVIVSVIVCVSVCVCLCACVCGVLLLCVFPLLWLFVWWVCLSVFVGVLARVCLCGFSFVGVSCVCLRVCVFFRAITVDAYLCLCVRLVVGREVSGDPCLPSWILTVSVSLFNVCLHMWVMFLFFFRSHL